MFSASLGCKITTPRSFAKTLCPLRLTKSRGNYSFLILNASPPLKKILF
jgi:hypothetical protein